MPMYRYRHPAASPPIKAQIMAHLLPHVAATVASDPDASGNPLFQRIAGHYRSLYVTPQHPSHYTAMEYAEEVADQFSRPLLSIDTGLGGWRSGQAAIEAFLLSQWDRLQLEGNPLERNLHRRYSWQQLAMRPRPRLRMFTDPGLVSISRTHREGEDWVHVAATARLTSDNFTYTR